MQRHKCWPPKTSQTLLFSRVATGIPLGNIAPNPVLLSLSLALRTTLQMLQFAAPLKGLLVAMGHDL